MFRIFNSLQFVGLFIAMPYIIGWLAKNPNIALSYLTVPAVIVYVIMFVCTVASIVSSTENWKL